MSRHESVFWEETHSWRDIRRLWFHIAVVRFQLLVAMVAGVRCSNGSSSNHSTIAFSFVSSCWFTSTLVRHLNDLIATFCQQTSYIALSVQLQTRSSATSEKQRATAASAALVYLGWLTDRAMHRTPRNRRGCTIFDIQTLWSKKCWPKNEFWHEN